MIILHYIKFLEFGDAYILFLTLSNILLHLCQYIRICNVWEYCPFEDKNGEHLCGGQCTLKYNHKPMRDLSISHPERHGPAFKASLKVLQHDTNDVEWTAGRLNKAWVPDSVEHLLDDDVKTLERMQLKLKGTNDTIIIDLNNLYAPQTVKMFSETIHLDVDKKVLMDVSYRRYFMNVCMYRCYL